MPPSIPWIATEPITPTDYSSYNSFCNVIRRKTPGQTRYLRSLPEVCAYAETNWADYIGDDGGIGDKGYVGTGLATPKKKPPGGELSTRDKDWAASNGHADTLISYQ